jgi:hypothetical protein
VTLQIGDFFLDRLPLGCQVRLDFAVAGFRHDAVEPSFLGTEELLIEFVELSFKLDSFLLCRLCKVALLVFKPGEHLVGPVIRE